MKILSIKINNILSIENAEITFDDKGLMLVKGWDYDNGRANGAGKTALFNAISFALFDKLPRKVTATEILRRGSKTGFAEVTLDVGGDRYMVRRSRPKGVTFFKGSETLAIAQEEWESKLKLNYTQFLKIMYCAQGTADRFLSAKDADKKTFLLQLLDLDGFSSAKKFADEKVKMLSSEVEVYRAKIAAIDSKVDAYQESLVDENVINYHIELANQSVANMTASLIEAQKIVKPDLSKYQKIEDDIYAKKQEMARIRAKREMLHDQYRRLNLRQVTFAGQETCRACGSSLDVTAAKTAHAKEVAERALELASIKQDIDACDNALVREKQIDELSHKIKDKKREESRDFEVADRRALELQNDIKGKLQEIKNLNLKLQNNLELQSKIKVLTESRAKLLLCCSDTQSQIELYKTVSAMYSPTGAQAYILDSVIESFNDSIQEYIKLLWSNVGYTLLSYKENVAGDVSAKFSEQLMMDGKEISIGSLSGGEYRALSLCVDFALIDVMERQFGIYASPIILDEPFDGLDGEGRELIIDLLGKIAESRHIIVIDHASEVKSMFSKVLMVEKRGGISTISLES